MADVIKLKIDILAHEFLSVKEAEKVEIIRGLEKILIKKEIYTYQKSWLVSEDLFTTKQNLEEYECKKCGKCFQGKYFLKRHLSNKISCDGKVFEGENRGAICPLCSAIKSSKEELKSHMEKHTDQLNRLRCQTCNYQYYRTRELQKHLARNINCKPIKPEMTGVISICPLCGLTKSSVEELKSHMDDHEQKLNLLKCSLCHFQFYKLKELKKHKLAKHNSELERVKMKPKFLKANSLKYQPDQLWHFLLNLLLDKSNQNLIAWTSNELEFKLKDPNEVARRWGMKRNKPNMNYDKLSRVLRFYYSKNILKKCKRHNFVYQFMIDINSASVLENLPIS